MFKIKQKKERINSILKLKLAVILRSLTLSDQSFFLFITLSKLEIYKKMTLQFNNNCYFIYNE